MLCKILKPFEFSTDGVSSKNAYEDSTIEIPTGLVAGLRSEGYLTDPDDVDADPGADAADALANAAIENKNAGAAPENKILGDGDTSADMGEDNGEELLTLARAAYYAHFDKRPHHSWSANDIHAKIDGEVS